MSCTSDQIFNTETIVKRSAWNGVFNRLRIFCLVGRVLCYGGKLLDALGSTSGPGWYQRAGSVLGVMKLFVYSSLSTPFPWALLGRVKGFFLFAFSVLGNEK